MVWKLKKADQDIFWMPQNRVSHCYFIKNGDGWDVIDTGVPVERPKIAGAIRKTRRPLFNCLLTHSHADHAGNAVYFNQKFHTNVFCAKDELPYIKGQKDLRPRDYKDCNPFCRVIQFGDIIHPHPRHEETLTFEDSHRYLGDYEFVPLPGHTPGSTGIIHKPTKSIFLGDALNNCRATYMIPKSGLHLPFRYFCEDHKLAIKSLSNLTQADFENAYFGHGDPILGNAKTVILEFLREAEVI